jgi:PAS domain S-box-containing protein
MGRKPTYEELEDRVKILEKESIERKRAEEALRESKERYALATRAAMVGVWDWNVQTGKFYLDPNVKAILGYGDEEIPNDLDVWATYVHPDDKQPVMEAFQAHLEGKTPKFIYEHRMLHKEGSVRWILARGTAMRDAQGNVVRVLGTDADITLRKRAEEALRESEKRYRDLVDNATDIIYLTDVNGYFTFANPTAIRIMGYSEEELIGKLYLELIRKDYCKDTERFYGLQFVEKIPNTYYEFPAITKDGKEIWLGQNVRLNVGGDRVIGFQAIARDITDRVQAEEALKARDKELQVKTSNLEETNTALKVLLNKRDEDRKELEEKVKLNMKWMVLPYLDKLKKSGLDERQEVYRNIVESFLNDIISPFTWKLSSQHLNLTPTEIQVANFVKEGKTTKEVAELLNSSTRAVGFHRESLRKKFGLKNKKTNLRSHLLSLI